MKENIYNTVKKHDAEIDGLRKKVDDHETRIEIFETRGMATAPEQSAHIPTEVKVSIPDDIVRKKDLDDAIKKITENRAIVGTPVDQPVSVTVSPMDAFQKIDFDKSVHQATKDEIKDTQKYASENNAILKRIEIESRQKSSSKPLRDKLNIMYLGYAIYTAILIIACIALFRQGKQVEHLKRVEWLYRWSRIGVNDTEEYQDFERRMLDGKKEEREGMKTKIFNMERNAPQFLYFKPMDDWTPQPPKPQKEEVKEQSKSGSTSEQTASKPMPHEQRSGLTPGEIEAIKRMRADPNIPEDAKPPLPDSYED